MNTVGTLVHIPMTCADRYLWTLPMFHANGWTFTWTVTAAGGVHVCLPKMDPRRVFGLVREEHITLLCAAPTVLISLANAPDEVRRGVPSGVRVIAAGAPPAAATIQRIEGELGWSLTQVYGLTETAPFITVCEPRPEHDALSPEDRAVTKARQGVELITSGELEVVDDAGQEVPHDGATLGEILDENVRQVLCHQRADLVQQVREVLGTWRDLLVKLVHRGVLHEFGGGRVHLALLYTHLRIDRVGPDVRSGHDEPADLGRVLHRGVECHAAAERIAHDVGPVQPEVVDKGRDVVGDEPQLDRPVDVGGAAVTLQVDRDDLMVFRQRWKYRPEHLARSEPTVQQHHRPTGPVRLVVEVDAIDLGVLARAHRV